LNEEGEGRATKTPRRKGTQRREKFEEESIKLIVMERSSNLSINIS
jgi:hypothetical protein